MLFDLLTLSDSNLPAGGYAFSNGLESASHLGLITHSAALQDYLKSVIVNVAQSELPFIQSCYAQDITSEFLDVLLETYDAMITTPTMAQASAIQGRNLLRIMHALYPSNAMTTLRQKWLTSIWPTHHTLIFGATYYTAGFAILQTRQMYLYQVLRDQISTAVRLGIIGPMEAVQTQKNMHSVCEEAIRQTTHLTHENASRNAPQIDIAQSFHQHLYSRLFQS